LSFVHCLSVGHCLSFVRCLSFGHCRQTMT
jgi:hypothetical protein